VGSLWTGGEARHEEAGSTATEIANQQREAVEGSEQAGKVKVEPIRHHGQRVGRNDPCPCNSGKKFKNCCMRKSGVT